MAVKLLWMRHPLVMLLLMNEHRHHWVGDMTGRIASGRRLGRRNITISCDDCSLQCTSACADCVVTYVLSVDERAETTHDHDVQEGLVLDCEQARVVRMLGSAGLVPDLKFQVVS